MRNEEEAEILNREHFIKYLYESRPNDNKGTIYIKAGLETEPEDLLQSVFAMIYSTYQGLKKDDAKAAELFRNHIILQLNSEEFWKDDDKEMCYTSRNYKNANRKRFS